MPDAIFDPPWNERVRFDPAGFAYVPNTAIVRDSMVDADFIEEVLADGEGLISVDDPTTEFRAIRGTFDAVRVVAHLRAKGIDAQPDHVLFAHDMKCYCCGPHPATWFDPRFRREPAPCQPAPCQPAPCEPSACESFACESVACESTACQLERSKRSHAQFGASGRRPALVLVERIREQFAERLRRRDDKRAEDRRHRHRYRRHNRSPGVSSISAQGVTAAASANVDVPDLNSDQWLDPAAGHGTFIAGIIERIAPGCAIEVIKLLGPQGEGSESDVVAAIEAIADREEPPAFLNLSFGGYVWERAPMLSAAVLRAQRRGIVVVASAGNDGTCRPSYPAAIPGVVSVGAIGPDGPAWFSNYGSWVRACAPGVDVVSAFFASFDGKEVPSAGRDIDNFRSWATWSGTSFAAPVVVGALVREMRGSYCTPIEAVERLIDAPWLGGIPGLGTVVNI